MNSITEPAKKMVRDQLKEKSDGITETMKKVVQESADVSASPAGFVVEVLRPKKGIEYRTGLDTLEDAESFVRRTQKKKPKWRLSILAMYRWPVDGVFLVNEVCDESEEGILDVRNMAFGEVQPYVKDAYSNFGWAFDINTLIGVPALLPPLNHKARYWAAKWLTIEMPELCSGSFRIPNWLPRVVQQQREQREEVAECSAAVQA